jgi:hypothetical protein
VTRSIRGSRRAALLLSGVAAATALLASGCGAGQVAETAAKKPSVQGANIQTPDNAYKVRGLLVQYPGAEGYQAGANAKLGAVIYNDTQQPVTVTITTQSGREILLAGGASASATPSESVATNPSASASPSKSTSASPSSGVSGSASPSAGESASASASPPAPAGAPARIEIPALGYVQLNTDSSFLQLVGLKEALRSGQAVDLTFDFGNGITVVGQAPVAVPLTPNPPASPIITREGGEESGDQGTSGHGG